MEELVGLGGTRTLNQHKIFATVGASRDFVSRSDHQAHRLLLTGNVRSHHDVDLLSERLKMFIPLVLQHISVQ